MNWKFDEEEGIYTNFKQIPTKWSLIRKREIVQLQSLADRTLFNWDKLELCTTW